MCSSMGVLVGETLVPRGWGDREWSFAARLYCEPMARMIRARVSDLVKHYEFGTIPNLD